MKDAARNGWPIIANTNAPVRPSYFVFDGKDCECAAFNITDDTVCGYMLDELRKMAENKFGLNEEPK